MFVTTKLAADMRATNMGSTITYLRSGATKEKREENKEKRLYGRFRESLISVNKLNITK